MKARYKMISLFVGVAITFGMTGCNGSSSNGSIKKKITTENGAIGSNAIEVVPKTITMPYNKVLNPAGTQVFFGDPALENHALDVALSPDKKTLAIEGRYHVIFVNTENNKIIYKLSLDQSDKDQSKSSYSGIKWFEENGKQVVVWGTHNDLMLAQWDGKTAKIINTFNFKNKEGVKASIPNEMVIRKENGKNMAYVVLNGNDEVVKMDLATGEIIWQQPTGLAPYGITYANGKLYVSNWAGSVPSGTDETAGIPWEEAKVNKYGAVSSGSVSVLDPKSGLTQNEIGVTLNEINVGLHPNDIITNSDQSFVYVANGNSDTVSVINTKNDTVVETISVRLNDETNPYFGDTPNSLALSSDGSHLYVANGMDNALAVVELGERSTTHANGTSSRVLGFIPTAAYPGGLCISNNTIYVANLESIGSRTTVDDKENKAFQTFYMKEKHPTAGDFNSHRMMASISIIPIPDSEQLKKYTTTVTNDNNQQRLALLKLLPRKGVKPVPVPERLGEPSVFKHVIYIIKENRTYDQVLGDVIKGNGDPDICTFGEKITPNAHNLVDKYVLLDNYDASSHCSGDGHPWCDASIVTDYIEKNQRAWFRSYTHVLYDAMAYPKTGFIWDDALDHGLNVRIYGETAIPSWESGKKWLGIYRDFQAGKPFNFTNTTTIKRVRGILSSSYPGYDSHNVPDVLRAKAFIDELKAYEKMPGDTMPNLSVMALPDDHTAGTAPEHPTPRAMVADNDLALGQIVEAVSKSKFWKNTVIFVTEDDSQSGWDHVSAYRTVGMVISPYTKTGKVISTNYNLTSVIRTMEQILGLPPMNVEDASAKPMFDVFSKKPDLTPYLALKNQIPLDEMNPELSALKGQKRSFAIASAKMAKKDIDDISDDLLNHIIWASTMIGKPYPAKYVSLLHTDDDD